jgi:hypothetical protein
VVLPTRLVVRESCGANGHPQAHELDRLYGRAAAPVAVG